MTRALSDLPVEPLRAHRLFQTVDVDVARDAVARAFCDHKLTPGAGHGRFDVCHNHARGQDLSLNYLRYGCDVSINPGELTDFYLVQIPLRGAARVRNGRTEVDAARRTGTVLNPTRETQMLWLQGCEKLLLQIDAGALNRMAERLLGRSLPCAVVFDPELQLAAPALSRWEATFRAAVSVADRHAAFGEAAHAHQALFEEELITGLLLAQPSTIQHLLAQPGARISSAQVNRARAFILDNLSEPITVSRIACAAGCSIRSLQLAFQDSFGCTPVGFLRRQRLDHAHMLLQSLPEDALVSEIAYDSGFSHLGRFSIAYRAAFGRSPRQTQRQNRFS